jgi:hypothetical protein
VVSELEPPPQQQGQQPTLPVAVKTDSVATQMKPQEPDVDEDLVHIPAAVQTVWLDPTSDAGLKFVSSHLFARVMTGRKNKMGVLPVTMIKEGTEIVRKDGHPALVRVPIDDCFYDPGCGRAIESAVEAAVKKEFGTATSWEKVETIGDTFSVSLLVNKGTRRVGVPVQLIREMGRAEHLLEFPLPEGDAELTDLSPLDISLEFDFPVLVKYLKDDIDATATLAKKISFSFVNKMSSSTEGQRPVLFVATGGKADQSLILEQIVLNNITVTAHVREGSGITPDASLLSMVLGKMFEGIHLETVQLAQQHQDVVVNFVLPNGTPHSATLATWRGIRDEWRNAATHDQNTAKNLSNEVEGSALSSSDITEIVKALDCDTTAASMLTVEQTQMLATHCGASYELNLGQFRRGEAVFHHRISLQALTSTANLAGLMEKKRKLETARNAKMAELGAAWKERVSAVASASRELKDAASYHGWISQYYTLHWFHPDTFLGFPSDNGDVPYERVREAEKEEEVKESAVNNLVAKTMEADSPMEQLQKEISKLQDQIDGVTEEIMLLRR